jgi:hypothetical protein
VDHQTVREDHSARVTREELTEIVRREELMAKAEIVHREELMARAETDQEDHV